jgi:hypothetical protein
MIMAVKEWVIPPWCASGGDPFIWVGAVKRSSTASCGHYSALAGHFGNTAGWPQVIFAGALLTDRTPGQWCLSRARRSADDETGLRYRAPPSRNRY